MIVQPGRKFSFVIEGLLPPSVLTDDQAKLYLAATRNLVLAMIGSAVAATPDQAQLDQISLVPYIGHAQS